MKELKDLKLKEISKLTELNEKDLKTEVKTQSQNLFSLKMKKSVGELKQTHLIKALRRYIARIKTIANSKGLNID